MTREELKEKIKNIYTKHFDGEMYKGEEVSTDIMSLLSQYESEKQQELARKCDRCQDMTTNPQYCESCLKVLDDTIKAVEKVWGK